LNVNTGKQHAEQQHFPARSTSFNRSGAVGNLMAYRLCYWLACVSLAVMRRWESAAARRAAAGVTFNSLLLPNFLDPYNLADSTFNFSEKALLALPMALLIICREIDISVAGIMAVASVAMGSPISMACRRRCLQSSA